MLLESFVIAPVIAYACPSSRSNAVLLSIVVAGLPAYVLIKVLTPGFYARKDMKTPVVIAAATEVMGR